MGNCLRGRKQKTKNISTDSVTSRTTKQAAGGPLPPPNNKKRTKAVLFLTLYLLCFIATISAAVATGGAGLLLGAAPLGVAMSEHCLTVVETQTTETTK